MHDAKRTIHRMTAALLRLIDEQQLTVEAVEAQLALEKGELTRALAEILPVELVTKLLEVLGATPATFFAALMREIELEGTAVAEPGAGEPSVQHQLLMMRSALAGVVHYLIVKDLVPANEAQAILADVIFKIASA